jgi:hypothetical protein
MASEKGTDHPARIIRRAAAADPQLKNYQPVDLNQKAAGLADLVYCTAEATQDPTRLFDRLRWGGQAIVICQTPDQAQNASQQLSKSGFDLTDGPSLLRRRFLGLPLPLISKPIHYFIARKVELIQPGQTTDRFTYHVHLTKGPEKGQFIVVKEVPTLEMVINRLRNKWPDLAPEIIEKRARKFSDKIFPIFLTREAAILKIVNRDLPPQYSNRVPSLLDMEKDEKGFAKRLHLSWLRNGGKPLSQIEFARQSADLLRALHDDAGVMHLDLRLDNFVITPDGVGFVDFGSAVRVDENLKQSALLSSLFEELMKTSEIQRMLLRMTRTGEVTSEAISGGLHKVDKAVDCFYLAMQISSPHANPDLSDLIEFDKNTPEARMLSALTDQILRPKDPAKPAFRSAADILRGIADLKPVKTADSTPSAPMQAFDLEVSKTLPRP